MRTWRPTALWLTSLTLLGIGGVLWFLPPYSAQAQDISLSGWLHVIWADAPEGSSGEPGPRYVLIDDLDQWTEIELDENHIGLLGGPLAFNRQRVMVAGTWEEGLPRGQKGPLALSPRLRVDDIQLEPRADAPLAALQATPFAVTGSQPWVTILCRFGDAVNVTPRPQEYFANLLAV